MHAVADGGHGDLTEKLDAGLLVGGTGKVDSHGTFHAIVVLVSVKE